MTTASFGDIDVAWEDPGLALVSRTLASFSRLILLNRRGTGASDPLPPDALPPWESYTEELEVILDEVGSQRAALLSQVVREVSASRASPRVVQTFLRAFLEADVSIIWETPELVLDQVEELLTGVRRIAEPTRVLAATPSRPADELGPQTLASIWVATPPDEPVTEEAQVEVVSTWRSKVRSWW